MADMEIPFRTSRISYGGTAAVVTSMALIRGLSAVEATKSVIVGALLVAALADNLADALSIHIFQESERLGQKDALTGTIANFVTRLLLCMTFVALLGLFPLVHAVTAAIAWGMVLLVTLSYLVARERQVKPLPEVVKHVVVASAAIVGSGAIGHWIGVALG
jgi:VIT1/CCC1 family predicted Fe2+/Mn2+ transporter